METLTLDLLNGVFRLFRPRSVGQERSLLSELLGLLAWLLIQVRTRMIGQRVMEVCLLLRLMRRVSCCTLWCQKRSDRSRRSRACGRDVSCTLQSCLPLRRGWRTQVVPTAELIDNLTPGHQSSPLK